MTSPQHGGPRKGRFLTWDLRAPRGECYSEQSEAASPFITHPQTSQSVTVTILGSSKQSALQIQEEGT